MRDAADEALLASLEKTSGNPNLQPGEDEIRDMLWEDGLLTAAALRSDQPDLEALTALMVDAEDGADIALAMYAINDMRFKNIRQRLRKLGPRYVPLNLDHPDEAVAMARAESWALGFANAIKLATDAWGILFTDPVARDAVMRILIFVSRTNGAPIIGPTLPGELVELRREAFPGIGEAVFRLYLFWQDHHEDARRHGGRLGKVGRNEPCPCGSGQKYKRCCLN